MHISPRALQRETILDLFRSLQNLIKFVCEPFFTSQIQSFLSFFGLNESIHCIEWGKKNKISIQSTEFHLQPTDPPIQYTEFEFSQKVPPIQCTELVGPKKGQPIQCTEFEVPFFNKPIQCSELVGQKGHFWIQCTELVCFSWIYCFLPESTIFLKKFAKWLIRVSS